MVIQFYAYLLTTSKGEVAWARRMKSIESIFFSVNMGINSIRDKAMTMISNAVETLYTLGALNILRFMQI